MGGTEHNEHGGVVHQVSGTVGVGSDSAIRDLIDGSNPEDASPSENDQ